MVMKICYGNVILKDCYISSSIVWMKDNLTISSNIHNPFITVSCKLNGKEIDPAIKFQSFKEIHFFNVNTCPQELRWSIS
jgi:hypothetical protein